MKHLIYLIAGLLLAFSSFSCGDGLPDQLVINPEYAHNIDVVLNDTIELAFNQSKTSFLDIDQNGSADINLHLSYKSNIHFVSDTPDTIKSLAISAPEYFYILRKDTNIIFCRYKDTIQNTIINIQEFYNPSKIYPSSVFLENPVSRLEIQQLDTADIINPSLSFSRIAGEEPLGYSSSKIINDTLTRFQSGIWQPGMHGYIGFEFSKKFEKWYGWVELTIIDYNKIIVHRHVLEKM